MFEPDDFARLERITLADFEPLRGEAFESVGVGELRLVVVERLDPQIAEAEREPFRLVFEGPSSTRCEQGLHDLRHLTLGRLPLFLVPLGETAGRLRLEAVIQ